MPEETEHLDVLIVGAGLSGIGAGAFLERDCPWARYAVFEARGAIGGTWDLFRYPGVRSDSDMFTLGYSFRPWDGEKSIAGGDSILRYIVETAEATGVDRKIRFHHRIVSADWSTPEARWHVVAERTDSGKRVELTASFLFSCSGYYRYDRGYLPDFAGMDDYAGELLHPQVWPEDFVAEGKRITVIGSGATAVTLVPNLAAAGAQVTMLQRSPTYIGSLPAKNPVAELLRKLPPRVGAPLIRWVLALGTQAFYQVSQRRPAFVKKVLRKGLELQLPEGYDIDTHFTPRYDPWDQRFCVVPDGDLFREIRNGNVTVVTDTVDRFTEKGIRLGSGDELEADVVVTATGLELLFIGGIAVTVDGEAVEVPSRFTYKGMMLEGVPNLAFAVGYTNASWTLKCDLTCGYVVKLLNHLRSTGLRQATAHQHDATGDPEPMLGLSSGYVKRSAHLLPRQGTAFPWRVEQSYLKDYRAMRLSKLDDGAMTFSNPAPRGDRVLTSVS